MSKRNRNRNRKRKAAKVENRLLVRAKFDSAQTTADNRKHWANADHLSADAASSPEVRRTLRNRARYEVANNSYARGIVLTLANDVIGTGPRLQMLGDSDGGNRDIETEFARWSKSVRLGEKLRTMRMALAQDGEAFAVMFNDDALSSSVQLNLKLIEADQVATPTMTFADVNNIDGIVLDDIGNPQEYHVLKQHPGSSRIGFTMNFDRIPAANMLHWFRVDRAGQHRGLPGIMPALPLFAQLRRYTLAVLGAAESAADIAVLMKTNASANVDAASVAPMTEMEFAPNMAMYVAEGWEPSQIKAEQPTTTYPEFKQEILNEIARCLNMPFNVAAGNSSSYNYASGRLDHQTYFKSIRVEQSHIECVILDRIFSAWLAEASLVFDLDGADGNAHQWFWDGVEHVDPLKEANAQNVRIMNGTTTYAIEYARQGRDWERAFKQRAKEKELMESLGLVAVEQAPTKQADAKASAEGSNENTGTTKQDRGIQLHRRAG